MQYINPCWQPIGGIQFPGGLDTVIGVTSFIPQRDYSGSNVHCADRNGIPYSYFASTKPAWDWIYETIDGKPLLLKSKMNHTCQNGCGNKAFLFATLYVHYWHYLIVSSLFYYINTK